MRLRSLVLSFGVLLVAASCAAPTSEETTTSSPDATTTTQSNIPDAVELAYSLNAGDTFVYEVQVSQTIDMTSDGEGSAFTDGSEEMPGAASVDMTASGTFTFDVAAGPQPGTYEVTITGELTDLSAAGTVDGEPLDDGEIPDFAEIEPVSVTVVVDEQGNVISEGAEGEDPLGGLFSGMGDLGSGGFPGAEMGQFFGPPFLDGGVTVGDTWSTSFDTPGLGDDPITTSITSAVTGTDSVDGVDVFVIESSTAVDPFEFDFGEFLIGMFTGFMPDDPSAEEQAEIDALVENLRFVMSFDGTASDSTTYFDAEAGLTRRFDVSSTTSIGMDVNFPDEETGELSGFTMEMTIAQEITHRLVTAP